MPRQRRRWPAGSALRPTALLSPQESAASPSEATSNTHLVKRPRAAYVLPVGSRGSSAFPQLAIERRTCFSFRVEI
jgi:hypothetical protein